PTCRSTSNWFGTPCRFKCHCVYNNACDNNGVCSSGCEYGWFGPSCQYVDLVSTYSKSPTPSWVYDRPDTNCNPDQETVTISLTSTFYFTWLRLHANVAVSSQDFKVQLMLTNQIVTTCNNMYTSKIDDTTLDIHCLPGAFFEDIVISGNGVKSLCTVYVSGGRNVALGQNTKQTSTYDYHYSSLAVDGDRDPVFEDNSCAHTADHVAPTWTLTFGWPHVVNRYLLFNRNSELT
ncbi:unnamed protein product, partial [Candidula unifasciata]